MKNKIILYSIVLLAFSNVVFAQKPATLIKRDQILKTEPILRPAQIPGKTEPPKEDNVDRDRKGPSNTNEISILEYIESDYVFTDYYDILNINTKIFEDQNEQSGYYYYFPKEYRLSWEPLTGYQMQFNYLSADASGKSKVVITMKLQPNISKDDVVIAEHLVKNAIKKSPKKLFVALQSIPLSESSLVKFQGLSGIIDPSDVTITVPSNFMDPIVLLIKTDKPDDFLTLLFEKNGIGGAIEISPSGDVPKQTIPFTLKLDYYKTFGTIELHTAPWLTDGWTNNMPYPVILKNLHVLQNINSQSKLKVFTWSTADKEIASGGKAKFDAAAFPSWLATDNTVKKVWLEYQIKPCKDCNTEVRNSLLNATARSEVSLITFDILDVLDFSKAVKMRLKVRSVQLDPNGQQKIEKNPPYTITQDGVTLESFQLFVPQGQSPNFEYSLSLIMPDGDIKISPWIANKNKTEIGIGRNFIKEHFPELNSN